MRSIIYGLLAIFMSFVPATIGGMTIIVSIQKEIDIEAVRLAKEQTDEEDREYARKLQFEADKPVNLEQAKLMTQPSRKSWIQGATKDGVEIFKRTTNLKDMNDGLWIANNVDYIVDIDGRMLMYHDDQYHRIKPILQNISVQSPKNDADHIKLELDDGNLYLLFPGLTQDENCWVTITWACFYRSGILPKDKSGEFPSKFTFKKALSREQFIKAWDRNQATDLEARRKAWNDWIEWKKWKDQKDRRESKKNQ